LAPHLLDYEQQDCQEFLRFLLDGLSEDLGRRKKESIRNSDTKPPQATDLLSLALGGDDTVATNSSRPQPPSNPKSLPDKFRSKIRSISAAEFTVNDQENSSGNMSTEKDIPTIDNGIITANIDNHDVSTFKLLQSKAIARENSRQVLLNERLEQVIKESTLSWNNYLKKNDSIITDVFGGQLQSTIECLTCHHRSHCFDPFLDLSVPIEIPPSDAATDKESKLKSRFGGRGHSRDPSSCTLEDCFASYSATEMLDGDNAYNCEKCKSKQKSSKRLAIYKYPKVLVS
jgi:hypothetical protein